MPKLPPAWDALIDHVEGAEAPFSCAVIDGLPYLSNAPIPSKPSLSKLAEVLRSDAEIPREIRNWIADMMTPGSDVACSLFIEWKRGRRRANILRYLEIVEHFDDLLANDQLKPRHQQQGRKRIEDKTCDDFNISRSTLLAYRQSIKKAREAIQSD